MALLPVSVSVSVFERIQKHSFKQTYLHYQGLGENRIQPNNEQ